MKIPVLILAMLLSDAAAAQTRRAGEMLVQLQGDARIEDVAAECRRQTGRSPEVLHLAENWRMYRLRFDEVGAPDDTAALEALRRIGGVRAAQWNRIAVERGGGAPNDPLFSKQWHLNQIGAPAAWAYSTGGLTPRGDTIVVAVLEPNGFQADHPDLIPNLWRNQGEIPANGIDDDANGYADDYKGWDARNGGDGTGRNGVHGTSVNGLIGAAGDNALGVAGVNWRVRLLNISNTESEDEIVAACYYAANMRRLYNRTRGQKGAFIVAANFSFGFDFERAEDHPLWCAAIDSLGAAGVLSAGAAPNADSNVELDGDMPSNCESPYLVMATNTDRSDQKVPRAGYGQRSIDLGAPGDFLVTTGFNGNYNERFWGASAAAPLVSGVIALLYSLPCAEFTGDALDAPAACARRVRERILLHTAPVETLREWTATGGRLDVGRASRAIMADCGRDEQSFRLITLQPNPTRNDLQIVYETSGEAQTVYIYDALGRLQQTTPLRARQSGVFSESIDVASLPAGLYFIATFTSKNEKMRAFVKM